MGKDREVEETTKVTITSDSDAFSRRIKENLADFTKPSVIQEIALGRKENGEYRSIFDVYKYNREIEFLEGGHGGKKKGKKKKKKKKKYINYREARKYRFK